VFLKRRQKAKAEELYKSQLFVNSLAYAKQLQPDKILILSALHHLLELETEIDPYDITLSNVPKKKRKPGLKILNAAEKEAWGKKVIGQLSAISDLQNDTFIFLAGQEYLKPLIPHIKNYEFPLGKLPQGKRLAFLKEKLNPY
jgi:hypothetical protein